MRKYAAISALLHAIVITIAWVGLPDLFRPPPPEEKPLIVEVLPLSQITNAPPPKPEPPKVAEAPKPPEPEPPKPEPPKVVEAPKPEPPKPPEPKPAPPPAAAPPPPPPPAPTPAPRAETPLPPPPKPRPEPPKPQPQQVAKAEPPQKQPQQPTFDLDNMLKDLTKRRPQPAAEAPAPAPQQQAQAAPRAASNAPHNPLIPLSMTEEDLIRQRVQQNWNIDIGAKGVETFIVVLQIFVLMDGSVQDARIISRDRLGDPSYQAFAEGARRAVLRSSPLPLPPGKAGQLTNGNLELKFSAKDMLGLRG